MACNTNSHELFPFIIINVLAFYFHVKLLIPIPFILMLDSKNSCRFMLQNANLRLASQ